MIHEPFLILDADFRIRAASRYFYETFKIRPQDVLGVLIFDLQGGLWNYPKLHELLDGELSDCPLESDFPGVGHKELLFSAHSQMDDDGSKSILLAIQDITQMRRAEKELRQFIYTVSHDLRQPVSKMITISEFLVEKIKSIGEEEKDYLLRMYEAGKRMKEFIDNLTRDSASNVESIEWPSKIKK